MNRFMKKVRIRDDKGSDDEVIEIKPSTEKI